MPDPLEPRLPTSPPVSITTAEQALQRAFELHVVGEDDRCAIIAMAAESAVHVAEAARWEVLCPQMAEQLGGVLAEWGPAPPLAAPRWEERARALLPQPVTFSIVAPGGASQFRVSDLLEEARRVREQLVALYAKISFPLEMTPGAPVGPERIFGGALRARMIARNMEPASALVTGLLAFFIGVEERGPGDDEARFRKRWEGLLQRGARARPETDVPAWVRDP